MVVHHPLTMSQEIRSWASRYVAAGLSIVPVAPDGSKTPAWQLLPQVWNEAQQRYKHSWKVFQQRLPTQAEIDAWYGDLAWGVPCGIAVIAGTVSGHLEIIDLDNADLVEPWAIKVEQNAPGLLSRLILVESPRPGLHVYFRSPIAGTSQMLAGAMVLDPVTGKMVRKAMIELKGLGGLGITPPSPPQCHASGRPYVYLEGRDLTQVPTITWEERSILMDAAKVLDQLGEVRLSTECGRRPRRPKPSRDQPGDDFNARGDWSQILVPHGWVLVGTETDGQEYWRRPGKSVGTSATVNYAGSDLLYVFSESAHPFRAGESYTKFAAYALLNHREDFKAAATALAALGYGRPRLGFGRRNRRK